MNEVKRKRQQKIEWRERGWREETRREERTEKKKKSRETRMEN